MSALERCPPYSSVLFERADYYYSIIIPIILIILIMLFPFLVFCKS